MVIWMANLVRKGRLTAEALFESGDLMKALKRYIRQCHAKNEGKGGDKAAIFPNPAGFCRCLGVGLKRFEELGAQYPQLYDSVMTLLEDEALNATHYPGGSAMLTATFFKRRLGYDEERGPREGAGEEIRVVFDHDIEAAGV